MPGVAYDLGSLADTALEEGDLPEAARLYDQGMALLRRAGNPPVQVVGYLESMARLAILQEDWRHGERLAQEGLTEAHELGDVLHIGANLVNLGIIARSRGDLERAGRLYRERLPNFWKIREMEFVADCLESVAGVDAEAGRAERAARLLAAAAGIREQHGVPITPSNRPRYEQDTATVRSALAAAFEAAWAEGTSLTAEEAVQFALERETTTGGGIRRPVVEAHTDSSSV
jgi:tetratricopeptide (TPR) repeat protein